MKITISRFTLTKRHALTISRGTSAGSENLLVTVEHEGVTGIGEMAPTSGGAVAETVETSLQSLIEFHTILKGDPLVPDESGSLTLDLPPPNDPWNTQVLLTNLLTNRWGHALLAALDMAMHDWQGKKVGLPVWKLFGLNRTAIAPTSVTVGINPPEVVREIVPEILGRLDAYALKVKLGSPDGIEADKAMFAAAQEAAPRKIAWRVDANGGWSVDDARTMIRWLKERDVSFVEQPLPRGQEEDLPAVHHDSPLPIFLDETIYTAADIPPYAAHIDGVNLKLMKCGGLREALRIIHTARAHGLKLMIGCMSESSLAITAAAHISPLVDALDLDSHLNLLPDPFVGAEFRDGRVIPNDLPGLGVRKAEESA